MSVVPDWSELRPPNGSDPAWRRRLVHHLRENWLAGRPLLVEAYLEGVPELHRRDFAEALGDLIAAEIHMWAVTCADPARSPPVQDGIYRARFHGIQGLEPVFSDADAALRYDSPLSQIDEFGRYIRRLVLGSGGMGSVYLAWDEAVHRYVALKVIHPGRGASAPGEGPSFRERFDREARAAAGCDHPNLIRLLNYGVAAPSDQPNETDPYLDLAFLPGPSLEIYTRSWPPSELLLLGPGSRTGSTVQYLKTGVPAGHLLPARRCAGIVAIVARAVDYVHRRGMIHRDLKPSNIRFNRYGEPVVVDFGLVKLPPGSVGEVSIGPAGGTSRYMAPEAFNKVATEASDIYSLGLVLYELLTGVVPLVGGGSYIDIFKARETTDGVFDRQNGPEIAEGLRIAVEKALRWDPKERYCTAAEFAEALEAFAVPEAVPKPVPKNSPEATPPARARRWPAAVLSGFFGIGLGGTVALSLAPRKENELHANLPHKPGADQSPELAQPQPKDQPQPREPARLPNVVMLARQHLEAVPAAARPDVRFLTLHHRHNNPKITPEQLRDDHKAMRDFLNALAAPGPGGTLTPVHGTSGAVVAIRLPDYGWTPAAWDMITTLGDYPYEVKYAGGEFSRALVAADEELRVVAPRVPIMRADWLINRFVNGPPPVRGGREVKWPDSVHSLAKQYLAERLDADAVAAEVDLDSPATVVAAVESDALDKKLFGELLPGRLGVPRKDWESSPAEYGSFLFHRAVQAIGSGVPCRLPATPKPAPP
ncbi:serine/threonine-protein kinase [Zavarzinella formosa]|uniref:serine/threonine-protein kinase n=1 Tax=Zavarzinella formosa TaxID=360055 RepID=UPI000495800E|nr:serine/threonine-protein kinase [Zavarzinella formosa]